ncbi:hypothetical protein BGZ70_005222 [Mortierella alpina]|uniref:Uncharacterized protein n=1 Tax=Mortierella alpina TaxID=64518 RepID=A0A9P6IQE3_MORAP|nr:hypothetical protein BGZ70_005222 [Mortierella alpina]
MDKKYRWRFWKNPTTPKAYVDEVAPIAKPAYVYYDDDDVYDSVLVEKTKENEEDEEDKDPFNPTTPKTCVDQVDPIAKTSYVYYDDDVYDSLLVETTKENDEEDNDLFVSGKTKPLAGGKKGGSAGLSTTTMAALIGASQM